MNKIIFIIVSLFVIICLVSVGCGESQQTSTTTTSLTTTTTSSTTTQTTTTTTSTTTTQTTTTTTSNNKVIRLYYYGPGSGPGDPASQLGAHCIYSAISTDGINFTQDPGVRFSFDTQTTLGITDPDVVQLNDGSWLMFVSWGERLVKSLSPTSSGSFILDESFSWNHGGVPGSFNFNGTVRTFVCYQGSIDMAVYDQENGTLNYIGVALQAPASGMIADPSVIQIGEKYLMFYKYCASPDTPPWEHEIYLATSDDGINWTQHAENRFICKGSVPGAVYYNNTIYIYYCGFPEMRVAISHDNGVTFTYSQITITGPFLAAVDPCPLVVNLLEST
jgi:hypothetical protein